MTFDPSKISFVQRIIRKKIKKVLTFFCSAEIFGLENLKPFYGKSVILAPNHISELDPVALLSLIPVDVIKPPTYFVSFKKSHYKNIGLRAKFFYGGLIFKILGAYPAEKGIHDYALSLKDHIKFLKNSYNVCIFPEGKCSPDGSIQKPKGGVGCLAYETMTPVVPIAIKGIHKIKFKDFFKKKI